MAGTQCIDEPGCIYLQCGSNCYCTAPSCSVINTNCPTYAAMYGCTGGGTGTNCSGTHTTTQTPFSDDGRGSGYTITYNYTGICDCVAL